MALVSTAFRIGGPIFLTGLMFDLRTGPTDYPRLMEVMALWAYGSSADAVGWGLGINSSAGAAKANGISFVADDGVSDPGGLSIGIDWTTLPGTPANYFRRYNVTYSGSQFQPVFFRSLKGISLAPNTSTGLWMVTTNAVAAAPLAALEVHVTVDI